jgi:hypothetical protein
VSASYRPGQKGGAGHWSPARLNAGLAKDCLTGMRNEKIWLREKIFLKPYSFISNLCHREKFLATEDTESTEIKRKWLMN